MRAKREGALLPFDKNVRCIFSRDDSERDEAELSEIDSEKQMFPYIQAVSYTHLTLPTIYSV